LKECLSNKEILKCFLHHFSPPDQYEEHDPPTAVQEVKDEEVLAFQNWLRSLDIIIFSHPIFPNDVYAHYLYSMDKIELNLKFLEALLDKTLTEIQKTRYTFIILIKLLHELAHIVLYKKILKTQTRPNTPPGFFKQEAGELLEFLLLKGRISHSGTDTFLRVKKVLIYPIMHIRALEVPDDWIENLMKKDLSVVSRESFKLSYKWKEVAPKSTTKPATIGEDVDVEDVDDDEEFINPGRSCNLAHAYY